MIREIRKNAKTNTNIIESIFMDSAKYFKAEYNVKGDINYEINLKKKEKIGNFLKILDKQ
jgi:hypothetical protein